MMYGTLGSESTIYKEVWHADDGTPRHVIVRHDNDLNITEVYSNRRRIIAYRGGREHPHCIEGNGNTYTIPEEKGFLETVIPLMLADLPKYVISNMGYDPDQR
jgi:hypothetical protein